jgi:hypothetical protein
MVVVITNDGSAVAKGHRSIALVLPAPLASHRPGLALRTLLMLAKSWYRQTWRSLNPEHLPNGVAQTA